MELPDLKAVNSYPMLYIMGLGYFLLLGIVTFLASSRADYMNKQQTELLKLLESCMKGKQP